ncbi:MAG: hypothetical protein ABIZ04_13415 [Opitutus sp.]
MRRVLFVLGLSVASTTGATAATELTFWHAYRHAQTGVGHFAFEISKVKRGLFFGSCGPSTRSLRWRYSFDVSGPGPIYTTGQIAVVGDDLSSVQIVAGTIRVDADQRNAVIDLEVQRDGTTAAFEGNGTFRIHKLK